MTRRRNPGQDDDGPGSGLSIKTDADPYGAIHPEAAGRIDVRLLTQGRPIGHQGSGDSRPPVHRPGSDRFTALPSRVANTLRWPDGSVTDLNGTPMVAAA